MTKKPLPLLFPKRFFWGVSTSAHQVEGGNHNQWTREPRYNAMLDVKSEAVPTSNVQVVSEWIKRHPMFEFPDDEIG